MSFFAFPNHLSLCICVFFGDEASSFFSSPFLTFLDQVYVIAYVITLFAFVLLVWIGRRYADMESMPLGEVRENLSKRLELLDEVWPLSMVLFCSVAVVTAWMLIPAGA